MRALAGWRHPLLAVLLALGFTKTASAESLYQVEVIVFEYNTPVAVAGEVWPPGQQTPRAPDEIELLEGGATFGTLAPDALQLAGVMQRLRQAANTHPLLHVGWQQPALSGGARAVRIATGTASPPDDAASTESPFPAPLETIDGFVRVRIGRSLSMDVDLGYAYQGQIVRITDTRKMRLGELYYFDHPLVGVLAQVVPLGSSAEPVLETGGEAGARGEEPTDGGAPSVETGGPSAGHVETSPVPESQRLEPIPLPENPAPETAPLPQTREPENVPLPETPEPEGLPPEGSPGD